MLGSSPVLTPAAFEEMALGFADRAASHDPSWAWVPASDDGPLAPPVGFLRSASILVPPPPPASGDDPAPAASDDGLLDESVDGDDAAAVPASPSAHRLELHIVHSCADTYAPGPPYGTYGLRVPASCVLSYLRRRAACSETPRTVRTPCAYQPRACCVVPWYRVVHPPQVYSETYRVPVLLLQGYGDDGRPWRVEAVRAHLGRCARAGPASLPLEMVSQARGLGLGVSQARGLGLGVSQAPRTPRKSQGRPDSSIDTC